MYDKENVKGKGESVQYKEEKWELIEMEWIVCSYSETKEMWLNSEHKGNDTRILENPVSW